MSEEVQPCPKCPPPGAPAWVMTFADLMSLLMCFFVLLLSFSEIEAHKFKQMAGSMRMAFGVQRQVEATAVPMGTSIVAQEFSPGKPEPTPVDDVRQVTSEEKPNLDTSRELQQMAVEAKAEELSEALSEAIEEGMIDVETEESVIIIRIREKGSFPSGEADLNEAFLPVIDQIRGQLAGMPGTIEVAGHTDNIPIATYRFRSNWELSSARAVSVLHHLLDGQLLDPERFEVKGLAETRPLMPNDTLENRARNRRVEIVIRSQDGGESATIEVN